MTEFISMISAKDWLLIVIAIVVIAVIGIPLISNWLSSRDFKKQVEGKRKERTAPKNTLLKNEKSDSDPLMESLANEAWLKSKQNIFGPK